MIKRKDTKLQRLLDAWQTHAAGKQFAGMTLAQFTAKMQPSLDARRESVTATNSRRNAALKRGDADTASIDAQQKVINAIKGDPEFGDDSALYQDAGYVPKSQKKSGLSRKAKTAPPVAKATSV